MHARRVCRAPGSSCTIRAAQSAHCVRTADTQALTALIRFSHRMAAGDGVPPARPLPQACTRFERLPSATRTLDKLTHARAHASTTKLRDCQYPSQTCRRRCIEVRHWCRQCLSKLDTCRPDRPLLCVVTASHAQLESRPMPMKPKRSQCGASSPSWEALKQASWQTRADGRGQHLVPLQQQLRIQSFRAHQKG